MTDWLTDLFGLVCGQLPAHTSAPGDVLLPFCQRCTGLYVDAAVATALHLGLRFRASERFLQLHGALLLLMVPLGYHWVPQAAVARMLSGVLFSAGVVCYLWLTAGPRVTTLRDLDLRGCLTYTAGIAATLLFVPAASLFGNVTAWYALVALASLGLASLALLVALNLARSIAWLARRLLHLHPA